MSSNAAAAKHPIPELQSLIRQTTGWTNSVYPIKNTPLQLLYDALGPIPQVGMRPLGVRLAAEITDALNETLLKSSDISKSVTDGLDNSTISPQNKETFCMFATPFIKALKEFITNLTKWVNNDCKKDAPLATI